MRDKLIDMLWELNDHVYPDYDTKADEILSLFDVSISEGYFCDYCEEERTLNKNKVCCKCTAMLYPNRN